MKKANLQNVIANRAMLNDLLIQGVDNAIVKKIEEKLFPVPPTTKKDGNKSDLGFSGNSKAIRFERFVASNGYNLKDLLNGNIEEHFIVEKMLNGYFATNSHLTGGYEGKVLEAFAALLRGEGIERYKEIYAKQERYPLEITPMFGNINGELNKLAKALPKYLKERFAEASKQILKSVLAK